MATIFQTVARELAGAFETATRPGGETFYRLRDGAPAWIVRGEIAHGAHYAVDGGDPRFPCDWVYRLMALAADYAAAHDTAESASDGIGEFAEGSIEVSIPRLFIWGADHANNRALCDEWATETGFEYGQRLAGGWESGAVAALQGGQYLGAERIAAYIVDAIETESRGR